jgi:fibronectin-binding autotransporter adhesin
VWLDASGRATRAHFYGIANFYYEFLDGTTVDVSGTRFASIDDRLWGGLGVGGTHSWADDRYALMARSW